MRTVYDFEDQDDVVEAARALSAIRKTEGWNVLRQRAEILRQEAAAQALEKGADPAEIRGRIEGVYKLLEDAEAILLQAQRIQEVGGKKATARGAVYGAGDGQL